MPARTFRRRRTFKRRGRKLNSRQKTQVKKLIGNQTEWKHFDTSFAALAVDASGVVTGPFASPTQGDGDIQRIGNRIHIKSLLMKFDVTTSDATQQVRIVVFRWKPDSTIDLPSPAKVFDTLVNNPAMANINTFSMQMGTIHVLYDKLVASTTVDSARHYRQFFRFGRRLGAKNVNFSNDAALTGTNNIYVAFVSDSALPGHPTVAATSRVVYTDA